MFERGEKEKKRGGSGRMGEVKGEAEQSQFKSKKKGKMQTSGYATRVRDSN